MTALDFTRPVDSRLRYEEVHVASDGASRCMDPPAASRWEDEPSAPLVGIRDVPVRARVKFWPERELGTGPIGRFRSNIEGATATHPPDDFGVGTSFDRHRSEDERPQAGALHLCERCLRRQCRASCGKGSRKPNGWRRRAWRGRRRAESPRRGARDAEKCSSQERRNSISEASKARSSVHH